MKRPVEKTQQWRYHSISEHVTDAKRPGGVLRGGRLEIGSKSTQRFPVAVPDICLRRQSALASVDRCPALTSLHPPPAALGSLSPEPTALVTFLLGGKKVTRRRQPCYEFAEGFPKMQPSTAGPSRRLVPTMAYGIRRFKFQFIVPARKREGIALSFDMLLCSRENQGHFEEVPVHQQL